MQMTRKMLALLSLFVSAFLLSCLVTSAAVSSKFGSEYNLEREKIGLPVLPADWVIDAGRGSVESIWYAPNWKRDYEQRVPVHVSKYMNFLSGNIDYETDQYFGKEDWDCEESICRESLYITYCYRVNSQCEEKETWQVIYQSQDTRFGGEFISFEEAKRILKTWGLSYP